MNFPKAKIQSKNSYWKNKYIQLFANIYYGAF